jgi:hypothetical protein
MELEETLLHGGRMEGKDGPWWENPERVYGSPFPEEGRIHHGYPSRFLLTLSTNFVPLEGLLIFGKM